MESLIGISELGAISSDSCGKEVRLPKNKSGMLSFIIIEFVFVDHIPAITFEILLIII